MEFLTKFLAFIFLAVIFITCRKDEVPDTTEDPVVESLIKEETKTETISSSDGGTIVLESGVQVEIPANAMAMDQTITVETIDPFLQENDEKIADELNGAKISAIIRCKPDGATFNTPVKIKIPYFEEYLPDNISVDSVQVISFSNDSLEVIPFTIDRTNKLIIAETTHFSDFTIKIKDGNWIIDGASLSKNEQTNWLKIGFSCTNSNKENIWRLIENQTINSTNYVYQRIYYNIRLYRIRKYNPWDEYIGGTTIGKAFFKKYKTVKDAKIIKGDKFDDKSIYDYDKLPEKDSEDIFKIAQYGPERDKYAATLRVVFDENKDIVSGPTFTDIGESDINSNFVDKLNHDGKNFYVDVVDMASIEEDEEYYLKIDVIGKGWPVNETKNKYRGEFTSSKFTLNDVLSNQSVTENSPPKVSTIKPGNATYKYKENFTLSCSATDNEDGTLSGESIVWEAAGLGTLGYGESLKSTDFNKELEIGTHKITVYAFDGVGASDRESFQIKIENNEPEVDIVQPVETSFEFGQLITFAAEIEDVEDENIIANRIKWTSSKDGEFKTAALKFGYDQLNTGTHEITVTYTDGHGDKGTDKVEITIEAGGPEVDFHEQWWNWKKSENSFEFRGAIKDDGGGQITDKGFVISSVHSTPTLAANEAEKSAGAGSGDFQVLFDNLKYSTTYNVRAYATNGNLGYSDVRQIETGPAPTVEAPSKVTAGWFPEKQGKGIYWQDNSDDEDGFVIEVAEDSKSDFEKLTETDANKEFYAHTFGTQHYYSVRVAAKKGEILSDWAEVAVVPKGPADLSAEAVDGGIKLKWYDRMGHNATKVAVMRGTTSTNLSGISLVDPGISSYTDENAVAGTEYYYQVLSQHVSSSGNVSRSRPTDVAGPVQYNNNPVVTDPDVTTSNATDISTTSATLIGNVHSDGGADIVTRGFYWSQTNTNPGENDNVETINGTTGEMTFDLTGLEPNTTYYYKAWAKNSENLYGYSSPVSFTTNEEGSGFNGETGTFTDSRDGNTYDWVEIGDQIWMAENLAYDAGTGCWAYDNDESNVATYGRLYTWNVALEVCPSGWHLPSDEEWEQLAEYISDQKGPYSESGDDWYNVGEHLKATSGWNSNGNGTDDFGFSGLPGGYRGYDGNFDDIGSNGTWWSATESSSGSAWYRGLYYNNTRFYRYGYYKDYGFSVRCLRD